MTRLDNVIKQVKEVRMGKNKPWIFDENGEIKSNILIGDVLPLLENLKEYEYTGDSIDINYFSDYDDLKSHNTYNWGANISNDINFTVKGNYALVVVHLLGDIRGGYSDYFIIDLGDYNSFLEFCYYELEECIISIKRIDDRYSADIDIFSEGYSVFDDETFEEVGTFYSVEKRDFYNELKEKEE